jgi:GNAT superfamily N-acetyltransferase
MHGANFGMMARHLAQTEFVDHSFEELGGGALALGRELWACVWQPEAISDIEAWVMELAELAETRGLAWGGVLVLCEPRNESSAAVAMLGQALTDFGLPRQRGQDGSGPEIVQILARFQGAPAPAGLLCEPGELAEIASLVHSAAAENDNLTNPRLWGGTKVPGGTEFLIARVDGEPIGFVASCSTEIVARVVGIWVDPAHRGKGYGRELLSQLNRRSTEQGRLVLTAWSQRMGKLRYFFAKLGFDEALSALYFLQQSA